MSGHPDNWGYHGISFAKLKNLPFGITDAGRQLAKEIESWLTEKAGFKRMKGLSKFYVKRDSVLRY